MEPETARTDEEVVISLNIARETYKSFFTSTHGIGAKNEESYMQYTEIQSPTTKDFALAVYHSFAFLYIETTNIHEKNPLRVQRDQFSIPKNHG